MSDIEERAKIVVEHLGVEESKIRVTQKFIDDLGADSLDTVELVIFLKRNLMWNSRWCWKNSDT